MPRLLGVLKSLRNAGHIFHTKGSHGKAYFPWKFPDAEMDNTQVLQAEKILDFLCSRLAVTYTQRFQARRRLRRLSDSSVDSVAGMTRHYTMDLMGLMIDIVGVWLLFLKIKGYPLLEIIYIFDGEHAFGGKESLKKADDKPADEQVEVAEPVVRATA